MIDYSQEHSLVWVTVIDDTGEIWCAPNEKVRFQPNWTAGRARSEAAKPPGLSSADDPEDRPVSDVVTEKRAP